MKKIILPVFFLLVSNLTAQETMSGLDVLEKNNFSLLENKKVALITNHSALNRKGEHILKVFAKSDKIKLLAIFSPEHGFTGQVEGGIHIQHSTDMFKIPLYSLYGKNKRPSDEMLKDIDTIVFDIQDVGARFYTYLTTMGYAMEEAAKRNISFIVLDRPNPIGLQTAEGPILSKDINNFTAYFPVPTRHGLTAGEMALFHKDNLKLNLNLFVVKLENYTREMFFDDTNLIWVNPSPNIRNLNAALAYPGIGCFEATNVSVGRGTENPFMWFGAPWMKAKKITKAMNKAGLPGVKFKYAQKTPDADMYKGEMCEGIEIEITDKKSFRALSVFTHAAFFLKKFNKKHFIIKGPDIDRMTGDSSFRLMLEDKKSPLEISKSLNFQAKTFLENLKEKGLLLYD